VLVPDEEIRQAIARGASASELRVAMRSGGYRLMRDAAQDLIAQGLTTAEEVNRVVAEDVAPAVAAAADRRDIAPTRPRHRVLIVDDDAIVRTLGRVLLEREGFDVTRRRMVSKG
jgi:PleD family two-component response regulator